MKRSAPARLTAERLNFALRKSKFSGVTHLLSLVFALAELAVLAIIFLLGGCKFAGKEVKSWLRNPCRIGRECAQLGAFLTDLTSAPDPEIYGSVCGVFEKVAPNRLNFPGQSGEFLEIA